MNRSLVTLLCCVALGTALACGKYGRPERIPVSKPVASVEAPADSSERDEEKAPKR